MSGTGAPAGSGSPRRVALGAAGLYLAVVLWSLRAVLGAPTIGLPYRSVLDGTNWLWIEKSDQRFVAWNIARNARLMLTHPSRLLDGEQQCHPTPNALTLGDHMLGNGLLGTVPYALTRDPILTFNAVFALTIWIAALAMYALVYHWTGSAAAALVAGFLFAFHPTRLADPSHPYVPGNQWTPLALLFAHRLFVRRRWTDAAGLTLSVCLQLLESFYQVIGLALIGGVYGVYLLVRHVRLVPALAPKLLAAGAVVAGATFAVLGPYLRTQATWGTLSDRPSFLVPGSTFWLGGGYYPGTVAVLLAAVGLLDRLRGPRRAGGHDPRLVLAFAGFLVVWMVVWGFTVPVTGWYIPPLYLLLYEVVPGLKAVRAIAAVGIGLNLVVAFLAGWGMLALVEHRGRLFRRAVTAAILAAAFCQVFHPGLATANWGQPVTLSAWPARPAAETLALARRADEGAVLDLPFNYNMTGLFRTMAYYVFWGAYHHQPVAACFNSFTPPVKEEVEALANRLPDPRAADALHALGFRTVVLHEEFMFARDQKTFEAMLAGMVEKKRLMPIGRTVDHVFYRLRSPGPVEAALTPLATRDGAEEPAVPLSADGEVAFTFRNAAAAVYRHPDPIEPTPLLVRWYDAAGTMVLEERTRALLPLALAPGEETVRALRVPVPVAAGEYRATVAPAADPALVLARRHVRLALDGAGR